MLKFFRPILGTRGRFSLAYKLPNLEPSEMLKYFYLNLISARIVK